MVKINAYLTEKQYNELNRLSKEHGIRFSEMRRILDEKLEQKKEVEK